MFGEFGRTPKINKEAGRDHWGRAFFALLRRRRREGRARSSARPTRPAAPRSRTPYSPMDLGATIYQALGVDHDVEVRDQLNRPVKLNTGKAIEAIYG